MEQLKGEIIAVLERARDEIRANMASKGINASGRTSDSIRVREYDGGVQLIGGRDGDHRIDAPFTLMQRDTAPIPTLEVGRAGGKVPRGFYYIIKEWSREKGIQFSTESERSTFAYFVAQKIAAEGTDRHFNNENVYSEPIKNAVGSISEVMGKYVQSEVAKAMKVAVQVTNTPTHF